MTMFTTAIPVWLNLTCGECGHHQDMQLGPEMQITEDPETTDYKCGNCGSRQPGKVNINGSSNANMRTVEEVRKR